ncbi:hypothetical protein HDU67_001897 [Dinochytrium kinnereticum]|nr:hypothetical protein HDU67_001897 [Dinochytrium kinnereticum]
MSMAAEERLNKRLDAELETLESQFGHILRSSFLREGGADSDKSKVKDKYKITQESQLMEGATANLIHSSESLLSLTAELKQALLLNDFKTLNFGMKHRLATLKRQDEANKSALLKVKDEITEIREEMEHILFSSRYIAPPKSSIT